MTKRMSAAELLGIINGIMGNEHDMKPCQACGLLTSEAPRTCKKCSKPCCPACQASDGSDCMGCGVSDEWKKAVQYGELNRKR